MPPTPRRPNLLWVMTDQQRFDALSAHGGRPQTPHLDSLAAAGADLTGHFAQSPVCVPSRSTLFTGRYPQAHRCRENDARLSPHEAHLPKILKHAGYHLGYFGKNHLLPDPQMPANFDACAACDATDATGAQRDYAEFHHATHRLLRTEGVHGSARFHDFPEGDTFTGRIGAAAREYLRTAPADRPWFATVSFHDPHAPHLAPRRFASLYPEEKISLPPPPPVPLESRHPRLAIKQRAQGSDRSTDAQKRRYLACYAAMCSFVDEQIGTLLSALRARPDGADTIVLFTSDHGDFNWHYGLGKKDLVLCDALLHVPCLISWPGRIAPRRIAGTFTEHADLAPTLLDLLGLDVPARSQQGRSFAPLLRGETATHRDCTVSTVCQPHQLNPYTTYETFRADWEKHHDTPGHLLSHTAPYNVPGTFTRSLRTAEWRYVWSADGIEELYDLRADPREWHNLAPRPEHAATLADLRRRCFELHTRLEDPRNPADDARLLAAFPEWSV